MTTRTAFAFWIGRAATAPAFVPPPPPPPPPPTPTVALGYFKLVGPAGEAVGKVG